MMRQLTKWFCVLFVIFTIVLLRPAGILAAPGNTPDLQTTGMADAPLPYVSYWPYLLLNLTPHPDNTPPHEPYSPTPTDGALEQSPDVVLSWKCGDRDVDEITYDVYLAADDPTPDVLVSSGGSIPNYNAGALPYESTYYWQVVATDEHGASITGPVWSFSRPCIDLNVDSPFIDGLSATFDGSVTSACSALTAIDWQWGDGISEDATFPVTHTYAISGTYAITVTAYDDSGHTAAVATSASVGLGADICTIVTELPQTECQALVELYQATAGDDWDDNAGWLQTNRPCRWRGIHCHDGHVTDINLASNNLTGDLPSALGNLTHLEYMYLYHNALTSIPADIGNLENLWYLVLGDNALTTVPEELWDMVNLQILGLDRNNLTSIPSDVGNLVNLTTLNLDYNAITSIPSELWTLTNLVKLRLSDNAVSQLPAEIGNLIGLQTLSVDGTNLTSVPSELWTLVNLKELRLDRNALTSVPPELGNLVNLTELNLAANDLTSVPAELGNLVNLDTLYLGSNNLTTIPADIGNLVNLSVLYLSSNALTSVPPELGNLVTLKVLALSANNGLTGAVPEFLTSLVQLNYFAFSDTQWCVPASGPVPDWLATIDTVVGTGVTCPVTSAAPLGTGVQMCRYTPGTP